MLVVSKNKQKKNHFKRTQKLLEFLFVDWNTHCATATCIVTGDFKKYILVVKCHVQHCKDCSFVEVLKINCRLIVCKLPYHENGSFNNTHCIFKSF